MMYTIHVSIEYMFNKQTNVQVSVLVSRVVVGSFGVYHSVPFGSLTAVFVQRIHLQNLYV